MTSEGRRILVQVIAETHRPGGSANVTANIRSLGGHPLTVAVIGRDASGDHLRSLFGDLDLEAGFLVEDAARRRSRRASSPTAGF
jgi:bifunctional ADP-heptose synthase (sugar kinase/adenylyltransferase)